MPVAAVHIVKTRTIDDEKNEVYKVSLREKAVESRFLIKSGCAGRPYGFTLVELIVVLVIISIASLLVIPLMSSAASVQLRTAANLIAADLEYAKNLAITRQQKYAVVFDADTESYEIQDEGGTVIEHPVKKGFDYHTDFTSDGRLEKVDILSVDFDGGSTVKFDYLGSPFNSGDTALNNGLITLEAEGATSTISVSAVTGYVTIN